MRRFIFLVLLLGLPLGSSGDVLFTSPFPDVDISWDGRGDVAITHEACISAFRGSLLFARASDFAVSVQPVGSGFEFESGGFRVPADLELTDLLDSDPGNTPVTAGINYLPFSYPWFPYCTWNGSPNAGLTVRVQASDLYQVPGNATYSLVVDVQATRLNSGGGLTGDTERQAGLRGEIFVPALAKISKLEDILLGSYHALSPGLSYNESFCVYSNTSGYVITPSDPNSGSSPEFSIAQGAHRIAYSVQLDDDMDASDGVQLQSNQQSPSFSANQGYPLSPDCISGDNAAVHVNIPAAEFHNRPAGFYSGTLTLQVAPI